MEVGGIGDAHPLYNTQCIRWVFTLVGSTDQIEVNIIIVRLQTQQLS